MLVNRWFGVVARASVVLVLAAIMAGCAGLGPQPDPSNPVRTVAILPFANATNNVDAPMKVRTVLAQQLKGKFYRVVDLNQVDQTMQDELGITLGDQIEELSFNEIAEKVRADALVFGNVTYFDSTIAGIINTNRVAADMRMVQTGTQSVLWRRHVGAKTDSSTGDLGGLMQLGSAIADATDEQIEWIAVQNNQNNNSGGGLLGGLIQGLAEKAIKSALDVDFDLETQAMVRHSLFTMRNGPGL